jgi:Zn-dependent protease with chaperone function
VPAGAPMATPYACRVEKLGARALASAALLAGFLGVAAVQLALVVVPVLLLLSLLPGSVALRLGAPVCIATVGIMAYATWRALHVRRAEPAGVPVARADAPRLWSLLDAGAAAAGTRPPDRVVVVAEAAATLSEHTRLLGLAGGRRDLYLGFPLLQAWDSAHLRAVVAHELGHFSPRLSRLAPLAYRGRIAVGRTVPRITRRNPAGPLLRVYARLYRRVDGPFSRAQELAADRIAAEFAGARAAAAVLHDLPALDALQRVFRAEYVGPGWRAGHVPDDMFGGFLRMLAARADEVARLRAREHPPPGTWNTHPPVPDRLAALSTLPPTPSAAPTGSIMGLGDDKPDEPPAQPHDQPAGSREGRGEGELVPDLPGLGRAVQAIAYPPQGRTAVGWDEFFGAARTAEMQREAEAALATISRAAGREVTDAAGVLELAEDGQLRKLAESVFADLPPDETAERIGELVTLLLALAALRSGVARWRHSWTGTAALVAADGGHLDLAGPAALAGDPGTVGAARERLAALGIDLTAAAGAERRTGPGGEVVGGVVNLVVDGSRTDVLIVDTGLVLVPGLPRSRNGSAKRRLARFAAADVPQREAAVPGSRFVPYADVAALTRIRRTPKVWDLSLRDGGMLTLRTALDSDELPGGWAALDDAVAFLARTR